MKGPSIAALPAEESDVAKSRGLLATVYHCSGCAIEVRSGFNLTNFIPSQNDPNTSHGVLFSSKAKLGSIAFQRSLPGTDWTTLPMSSHLKSLDALSSVLFTATPIQDVFLPNTDT